MKVADFFDFYIPENITFVFLAGDTKVEDQCSSVCLFETQDMVTWKVTMLIFVVVKTSDPKFVKRLL
jgi:hypothetical protein